MSKSQKKAEVKSSRKSPRFNQVSLSGPKSNSNFQKFKKNFNNQRKKDVYIEDMYEKVTNAKEMTHKETGLIYDTRMVLHRCVWDPAHQECPDRFIKTLDRCMELGLVERCRKIPVREVEEAELLSVHTQEHIDRLKATRDSADYDHLETIASKYDAVYLHAETYNLALLSAGCTVQLVEEVCKGNVQNGMAIVRPPGHHAMESEFCGYCFFNNVAVAARHALDNLGVHKILIVDWDVHHGQATQQMFYHDPRVVYFSIHRYEHGDFWPNLRESEYDYVGEGEGEGYNFNVPLNKTGMSDADYLAIFQQLLLPVATEFQPELIIVSAGYDAAVGCPEGEMAVTPACYAHLVTSLMGLASGKVAVILEGGYCVRSLAEGAALTLRALLGDPCPNLPPMSAPSTSIQESILNCIYSHRSYWRCLCVQGTYLARDRDTSSHSQHWPQVTYNYSAPKLDTYPTRDCCPVQTQDVRDQINHTLDTLISGTRLLKPRQICFVYDPLMMEHRNLRDLGHPERPSRIQSIYERHLEYNLLERLNILQSRSATREELLLVHKECYLQDLEQLCVASGKEKMSDDVKHRHAVLEKKDSVYIHPESYKCACLAAGSVLQVVDSVLRGESKAGVAVVRPPGHHAESYQACGFCMFNNVSIAAKYAIKHFGLSRILILDWDVHHGNGTQRMFLSDPQVLYVSIHRYDRGTFFPSSEDAAATVTGSGPGLGFNVNIPWNQKGMGNAEYITAFLQIVLPIAYQFSPELVLVSAGFDAAVGDPLGGCKVTPEAYGLLTSWLMPLAMGRVILCLEGGYNLTSISYSMTMCTKTLLGDPVPSVDQATPLKPSALADLRSVLTVQAKHWDALCFNRELPKEDVLMKAPSHENRDNLSIEEALKKLSLSDNNNYIIEKKRTEGLEVKLSSDLSKLTFEPLPVQAELNLLEVDEVVRKAADDKGEAASGGSSQKDDTQPSSSSGPSSSDGAKQPPTTTLEVVLKGLGMDEGFAVYPRHDCPHLPAVLPVPSSGIDISSPCQSCLPDPCANIENWICLTCYTVHCGRVIKEHMMVHSAEQEHPIVLGFQDLSVWCYACDSYIESPVLYEAKNAAYINKFGQTMLNIYSQ